MKGGEGRNGRVDVTNMNMTIKSKEEWGKFNKMKV